MSTLFTQYKRLDPLYKFILLVIVQYLIWFILYDFILLPDGRFDYYLTTSVTYGAKYLLNVLGYETSIHYSYLKYHIVCNGIPSIGIASPCNGQVLYALFIGFIIATPGKFRKKLLFIPIGILIIYIVNVIRVFTLVLIKIYEPSLLHFNHKYTFTIIVYGIIFALWMYWIKISKGDRVHV